MSQAVAIRLKPNSRYDKQLPMSYYEKTLANEYATNYLESMNAYPTPSNVHYVLKEFPINNSLILPVWSRETVFVVPGTTSKEAEKSGVLQSLQSGRPSIKLNDKKVNNNYRRRGNIKNIKTGVNAADPINEDDNYIDEVIEGNAYYSVMGTIETDTIKVSNISAEKIENNIDPKVDTFLRKTQRGRNVSWCTVDTFDIYDRLLDKLGAKEVIKAPFKKMLAPLVFNDDQIGIPLGRFCASIMDYAPSVGTDETGKAYEKILDILTDVDSLRLYGLLSHYCYWNIIHPFARRTLLKVETYGIDVRENNNDTNDDDKSEVENISLSSTTSLEPAEKEALFLQLQQCFTSLQKKLGYNYFALTSGHQALISCCHYVVDEILTIVYPWLLSKYDDIKKIKRSKVNVDDINCMMDSTNQEISNNNMKIQFISLDDHIDNSSYNKKNDNSLSYLRLQIRRLLHQAISDVIDPSRIYTSTMISASKVDSHKEIRRNKCDLSQYYCTSVSTRAIFSDSNDPNLRRFLSSGASDVYVPVPGINNHKHNHTALQVQNLINVAISSDLGDNSNVDLVEESIGKYTNHTCAHVSSYSVVSPSKKKKSLLDQLKLARSLRSVGNNGSNDIDEDNKISRENYYSSNTTFDNKSNNNLSHYNRKRLDFKNLFKERTRKVSVENIRNNSNMNLARDKTCDVSVNDIDSLEDDRSLIDNKNADVKISIKAKSSLLTLLIDKATISSPFHTKHLLKKENTARRRK